MRLIVWASMMVGAGLVHVPLWQTPVAWSEVARTTTLVRFDFDDRTLAEAGGRLVLRPATVSGGEVVLVPNGTGWAMQFPPVCDSRPRDCPRAILESDRVDWLNPDTRRVVWGASVRMTSAQVSEGANVVQKGLSSFGTQFKLQVDGEAGQPSCVMAGQVERWHRIFVAMSGRGIADGAWHDIVCERDGGMLRLLIDGVPAGQEDVPATLSIVNDLPLRVGGKGDGPNNDQFHGTLDNVFVEIG